MRAIGNKATKYNALFSSFTLQLKRSACYKLELPFTLLGKARRIKRTFKHTLFSAIFYRLAISIID